MVESGLHTHMVSHRSHSSCLPVWALSALTVVFPAFGAKSPDPSIAAASNILRQLPIVFEPNAGTWGRDVKFSARTGDYRLFLTARGATLSLPQGTVSISLLNANRKAEISGADPLGSRTSYFLGARKENWRTGVANYARVRYRSVYPGIDLVYYGAGSQLEYDFTVHPGADPNRIRLQFQGMDRLSISPEGDLVLETDGARLIQKSPVVYQEQPGSARRAVRGKFKLLGRNLAGFEIETYDRSLALTIDPVLTYSSLIGSSGADAVIGVKIDRAG